MSLKTESDENVEINDLRACKGMQGHHSIHKQITIMRNNVKTYLQEHLRVILSMQICLATTPAIYTMFVSHKKFGITTK